MTISSTNRKAGPFIGNGSASVFAFSFRVFAASDLEVVRITVATGVETTLTINSAYTVSLNADQNSNPGGSITLTGGALASGYNLIITSDIANLQPTDLTNQGGFYPEVITGALDRATIQIQQLDEHVSRTLSYPITDPTVGTELPPLEQRKGTVLAFDETTGAPEAGPSVGAILTVSGNIAAINTVASDLSEPVSEIETVAGSIANVNAVGPSIASVNTVAPSIANVNTVSGSIVSVNTVAGNIAAVQNASANASAAASSAAAAASSATSSASSAAAALTAKNSAEVAAEASGNILFYDTKALANAALAGLTANQVVEVFADESLSGQRTRYRKESGVYVFKLDLSSAPFAVYVDGVAGNDSNTGRTPSVPFLTIARAMLEPLTSGSTVYLKRNSVLREQVDMTSKPAGIRFAPYGAGPKPIISGQDVITAFAIEGAGPAYSFTISLPAGGANRVYPGVWEDGKRLTEIMVGDAGIADAAAAIAAVQSQPGTFYFAGPGTYGAGWAAGTKTYYIHSSNSSNPSTNGKVYEAYKRQYCVNPDTYPTAQWSGIHFQLGFHHDGFGDDFDGISVSRMARHGNLPTVPTMRNVTVTDPNLKLPGAYFHSNPGVNVADCVYDKCIAAGSDASYVGTAFFSHGGTGQSGLRKRALIKDCEIYNVAKCIELGIVSNVDVVNLKARNFTAFAGAEDVMNIWNADVVGGIGGSGDGGRHFSFGPTAQMNIYGGRFDLNSQHGVFNASALGAFRMEGSFFVFRSQLRPGANAAFFNSVGAGTTVPSVTIKNAYIINLGDAGFDIFLSAPAITTVDIQNVLIVNGTSQCVINGASTAITALDPDARVYTIDEAKVIDNASPGAVTLKHGVYEPGDFVYSSVAHPGGATQPRAFVAVGDRIYYETYTVSYVPASHLNGVCFVTTEGRAIAVGDGGLICRSAVTNPAIWATMTSGTASKLRAVAGTATTAIAVGDGGILLRSADSGATWTAGTSNTTRNMHCIAANGTTWIAAGAEGRVIRSTDDGVTWAEATVGTLTHYAVHYSGVGSLFVLGSENGELRTSTDGASWTSRTTRTLNRIVGFAVCLNKVYAALRQTSIYTDTLLSSTDGINWIVEPVTFPFELRGIAGGGTATYIGDLMAVGEASSAAYARAGVWSVQRIKKTSTTTYGNELEKWRRALA